MSEKFEKVKAAAKEDKKWLIRIGVITVIVVVFYFIASPYQSCKRQYTGKHIPVYCAKHTSW